MCRTCLEEVVRNCPVGCSLCLPGVNTGIVFLFFSGTRTKWHPLPWWHGRGQAHHIQDLGGGPRAWHLCRVAEGGGEEGFLPSRSSRPQRPPLLHRGRHRALEQKAKPAPYEA